MINCITTIRTNIPFKTIVSVVVMIQSIVHLSDQPHGSGFSIRAMAEKVETYETALVTFFAFTG